MRGTPARRWFVAATLVLAVLPACTDTAPDDVVTPSEGTVGVDLTATEAGDLRLELETAFGLYAHLLLEETRANRRAAPAVTTALADSQEALGDIVAEAYDDQAGRAFVGVWRRFSDAAQSYVRAVERNADTARPRRALLTAAEEVGAFLATTTDERMEVEGTQALLRTATRQFIRAADAGAEPDFEIAYLAGRELFADMVAIGRTFSAGISEHQPEAYPGPRSSGVLELKSALRQLLAENAVLTVTVLRRGATGAKDFAAAAAALNGNTDDLLVAIESVYGSETDPLGGQWRDRISALADYTVAAVERPRRRGEHERALRRSDRAIAGLLAAASDDHIDGDTLHGLLTDQTEALLASTDAYADREFTTAQNQADRAYRASGDLADVLADGIAEHRPSEFPSR
jgi:hypothetical protein